MPWGRAILAVLAVLVVVGGAASLYAMGTGVWRPDFSTAPGVDAQNAAALAAPYDDVSQGRGAALEARLVEPNTGAQAEIARIQRLLPEGRPTSSRLTSYQVTTGTNGNQLWGVHEYEYPSHVVRAETTLYRASSSEPWKVSAFHVNVMTREDLAARTFDFRSEPPAVQAVVVAAVIVPLFTLITFLVALFRRGLKLRWLWLIGIALGVGTIYANTGTDVLSFVPISVQLFGAGATWSGSMFDGWVFSAATPFGAAAFWLFAPKAKEAVTAS